MKKQNKKKEYKIGVEVHNVYLKAKSAEELVRFYEKMKLSWMLHNRIVKAIENKVNLYDRFWGMVRAEYPELRGKSLSYNSADREITIDKHE